MILLFLGIARAGVPIVYDGGNSEDVVTQAAARTGLPPDQLSPVALDRLLDGLPRTLGAATLRFCAGAGSHAVDLAGQAVRAELQWRNQDARGAMDLLDLGIASAGCLSDRVEPDIVSRMFLLRGGLLAHNGDVEGARGELRTALSLAPQTTWDPSFPPEGGELFASVRGEPLAASLTVAPSAGGARPGVDGRTAPDAPLPLRSGLHLVQLPSTAGLRSAWLTIEGEATLVLPGSYRRPILERMGDPTGQPDVARLLLATLDGGPVYVTSQGGLWLVSTDETTTLAAPTRVSKP